MLIESRSGFYGQGWLGSGWEVSDLNTNITYGWCRSKKDAIKKAIEKTRKEGDYGAAVALIAEVMLNEKE